MADGRNLSTGEPLDGTFSSPGPWREEATQPHSRSWITPRLSWLTRPPTSPSRAPRNGARGWAIPRQPPGPRHGAVRRPRPPSGRGLHGRIVTRIAVSGHRGLTADVAVLIDRAIRAELASEHPGSLVGISC